MTETPLRVEGTRAYAQGEIFLLTKAGDRLEFKVSGGIISIIPKLPSADDEYTPAQRRNIDAQLEEARKGPYHGPFDTADAALKFLTQEIRKRNSGKSKPAK